MNYPFRNKNLYLFILSSFIFTFLCSCDKLTSEEKQIIGEYKISEFHTIEASNGNPELGVSIDGKSTFYSDKKLETQGILKIHFNIEIPQNNYYNSFTLEFAFDMDANWKAKDGILTQVIDSYNLSFHSGYAAHEDLNTQDAIETFKKSFSVMADSFLKTYIAKSGVYKIQELTPRRMMLENNGQRVTYFRLLDKIPS